MVRWTLPILAFVGFAVAAYGVVAERPDVAFEAFAPLILPAATAAVVIYLLRGDLGAPGGVWEVDQQGYPVRFIAKRPPPDLAADRGVTHAAFIQSVRSRTPRD